MAEGDFGDVQEEKEQAGEIYQFFSHMGISERQPKIFLHQYSGGPGSEWI